jgi:hypothetical protein
MGLCSQDLHPSSSHRYVDVIGESEAEIMAPLYYEAFAVENVRTPAEFYQIFTSWKCMRVNVWLRSLVYRIGVVSACSLQT